MRTLFAAAVQFTFNSEEIQQMPGARIPRAYFRKYMNTPLQTVW